jgi:gamma-glutamyl-gamma-aminobutyrate hydrolase PuuD
MTAAREMTSPGAGSTGAAPVIGLTAYCEQARWARWDARAVLLPASYGDQVRRAGGVPVLLPPVPAIARVAGRLDGLVLTGGGDIDPATYGELSHPRTTRVSPERDEAELAVLAAALAAGIPVLGICRGLQVLNVARGGTLCQHLPEEAGHTPPPGTFGSHRVRLAPGSRLAQIHGALAGDFEFDVATSHHQAIGRLGDGLVPAGWALDGVIEAVELDPGEHPFVLAVQWHPEAGRDDRLMAALVAAARGAGSPFDEEPLHSRA